MADGSWKGFSAITAHQGVPDDLGVPFGWILAAGKALNHLDNLISDHLKVTSFAARDLLLYTERGREGGRERERERERARSCGLRAAFDEEHSIMWNW
jgi:hypothetical protein